MPNKVKLTVLRSDTMENLALVVQAWRNENTDQNVEDQQFIPDIYSDPNSGRSRAGYVAIITHN